MDELTGGPSASSTPASSTPASSTPAARLDFDWSWHAARLRSARSYWIGTTRPGGRTVA